MVKPTTDPLRLRILKALSAALEEISPDNGDYWTDLSPSPEVPRRVFRGRVVFGDSDPLPMVSILEVPLPPDQFPSTSPNPNRFGPWQLMIQGFLWDDENDPTDPAQYLVADVVSRLAQERVKKYDSLILGFECIDDINIGVGVVRPPDEISAKAYFWLPIDIVLAEDLTRPYSDNAPT